MFFFKAIFGLTKNKNPKPALQIQILPIVERVNARGFSTSDLFILQVRSFLQRLPHVQENREILWVRDTHLSFSSDVKISSE